MLTLDFSQDYLQWVNTESVTLQNPPFPGGPKVTIDVARRRALTYKELTASQGAYTSQDLALLVPTTLLPDGFRPKPGCKWIADGSDTEYTALEANPQKRDSSDYQTWKLVSRNLALAYELADLIDIERPTLTYDTAGALVKEWPPKKGEVPYKSLLAKVQLQQEAMTDERLIRGFTGTHLVIVSKEIVIGPDDRIKWGSLYLEIVGYHNAQRIDELPVIDAELRP